MSYMYRLKVFAKNLRYLLILDLVSNKFRVSAKRLTTYSQSLRVREIFCGVFGWGNLSIFNKHISQRETEVIIHCNVLGGGE